MARRCRWCREHNIAKTAPKTQFCCGVECAVAYAKDRTAKLRKREAKEQKQKFSRQKREFYESDIKTRKSAAIKAFNAFIRERDKLLPCISCGSPIRLTDYDAGHYIPAGSNSLLRFDEDNCHGQCAFRCNHSKSGNQIEYRKGLLARRGQAVVDRLENTNGTIKRTAADYKAIEIEYKEKLKQLLGQA